MRISKAFQDFSILMVVHDFLARLPGDPRGAGESLDVEKWVSSNLELPKKVL